MFLLIQSVAWQVVPILCNSTSNVNSSRFIQLEQGTNSFRIMKILYKFKLKFQSYRLLLFCIPGLVILVLSVNLCTHSHIFSTNFLFLFLFVIFYFFPLSFVLTDTTVPYFYLFKRQKLIRQSVC